MEFYLLLLLSIDYLYCLNFYIADVIFFWKASFPLPTLFTTPNNFHLISVQLESDHLESKLETNIRTITVRKG